MNKWFKNLLLISLVLLGAGWGTHVNAEGSADRIGNPDIPGNLTTPEPSATNYSVRANTVLNQINGIDNQLKSNPPPANAAELYSLKENLLLEYGCYRSEVCPEGSTWIPMSIYGTDLDAANFARLQSMQRHWNGANGIDSRTTAYEETRQAMNRRMADLQAELAKNSERKARADIASQKLYEQDVKKDIEQRRNCGLWNWGPCFVDAVNYLSQTIIKPLGEIMVKGANYLFNASFQFSVRDFANYASSEAVKNGWTIVRDLSNLGFIFALLYAATSLIIQLKNTDGKRIVGMIVIGALLVNFSAFFVGVVINLSNSLANQIYLAAAGPDLDGVPDLAGKIIKYRHSNGGTAATTLAAGQSSGDALISSIMNGLGMFVLAAITSVVLLTGALMMLARLLKLLLVIVLSPMMFLGLSLPLARSWGGEWVKNTLFSEAAFAPAYLLMLLIASRFISAAEFILPGKTSAFASAVFYNFITIGLMIASLIIAKFFGYSSGLYVGKKLGNLGKSLAGGATFGTAGRLGRATIGRMGKNLAESGGLRDAASQRGARGWIARQTLRAGDTASKLSFDARAVDSVKKLGLGNAQKGGYVGDIKKKSEIAERDAKLLAGKDSAGSEVSAREQERVKREQSEITDRARQTREQAEQRKVSIETAANAEIAAKRSEEEQEKDRIKKDAAIKFYGNGSANSDEIKAEQLREEGEVRARIEAQIKEIERRRDEEIAKAQKEIDRSEEIKATANKIQPRNRVQELADQFDDQKGKDPQSWYRFNRWRGKVTRTRNAQAAAIRKQAKSPQEKYKENLNKLLEQVEKPPENQPEKPTT